MFSFRAFLIALLLCGPAPLLAQGFKISFGGAEEATNAPVEVSADSLTVSQNDGSAVFTGNVIIARGAMRMTAETVNVFYKTDAAGISRLVGKGGVTIVSGDDAAEAQSADYDIDAGKIEMMGDVLLVQGNSAMSADRMTVNLADSTAEMHGRVRTVLQQGGN